MAGFSGSWGTACGHPVQPGSRFCSVCGQPVGAVDVASGAPTATGGQPPAPALPPSHQAPSPQAPSPQAPFPQAQAPQAASGQPGFPPPPPESGSRRPWPAPDGAPSPASYPPAHQQSETQWLWEDPARTAAAPSSGIVQPTVVQPGGLPPGALPPGSAPYGPPAGAAPTAVQPAGGPPPPWPQGPGGPQAPGENENTATMPGMPGFGSGGGDQWGPGGPWGPGGQWGPGGWQQPGTPGRAGFSGLGNRLSGLRVPRGPVVPALGVAALIVVVAAVIVATRGSGGSQQAGNTTGAGASPSASASASPTANPQEQQAAAQLANLLSQSGGDRGAVNRAFFAVEGCKALPADQAVFAKAAANRQNLVSKLGSLPGASALNPTMIQALNGAWTASAQADTDYANWAASLEHDCKPGKTTKNPNFKAGLGPDGTATRDKKQFTALWNPLAAKYGLHKYTPGAL